MSKKFGFISSLTLVFSIFYGFYKNASALDCSDINNCGHFSVFSTQKTIYYCGDETYGDLFEFSQEIPHYQDALPLKDLNLTPPLVLTFNMAKKERNKNQTYPNHLIFGLDQKCEKQFDIICDYKNNDFSCSKGNLGENDPSYQIDLVKNQPDYYITIK